MQRAPDDPLRVAVTGATGLIGGLLVDGLDHDRFEVRALDRADADVTDLDALERAFAGAEALVHLAADSSVDAAWDELLGPNVVGAYHAYEAAVRAGVRRVVFASSNHAVGMYLYDEERFADPGHPVKVDAAAPIRPDSLYGATKAFGEALGRLYADRHGLEVVCLRIGWVTDDDEPPTPERDVIRKDPVVSRRARGMWLSHRDCVSLVAAALSAQVRFAVVNGVGDNVGRWFSLDEGRRALDWWPREGVR